MTNTAWIDRQSSTKEARQDYERERLTVWAFDCIAEAMDAQGLSKADIARALGTSRAHVTQLFSGQRNPTLRTLADLAFACDSRVVVNVEPLRAGEFIASPACIVYTVRPQCVEVEEAGPAPRAATCLDGLAA
jgi:transcriptional regulator with XRE-family HTH domain